MLGLGEEECGFANEEFNNFVFIEQFGPLLPHSHQS